VDALNALAKELDTRVEVIACDLGVAEQRVELLAEIERRDLQIDILVNNAGLGTMGPIATTDIDRELQMVRVNVEAVIDLCTRVIPGMVSRRSGAILNVSSTAAFTPMPGQAGYAATTASCSPIQTPYAPSLPATTSPLPRCARARSAPSSSMRQV
jgi:hypothetical protein